MKSQDKHRRVFRPSGFTLVELLVVIAVIGVIAGIGVFAVQPFQTRSSVGNGGVLLQSWLNAARSRAIRDRAPRGLRLLPGDEIQDDNGNNLTYLRTKCVFIDQPDDIFGIGIDTTQNKGSLTTKNPPTGAAANDSIEVNGGSVYRISIVAGNIITLATPFPYTIQGPSTDPTKVGANVPYRIIRAPQPATSVSTSTAGAQDFLRLPRGSTINVKANSDSTVVNQSATNIAAFNLTATDSNSPPNGPNYDIVFGPNGNVLIGPNPDKIILWVTGTNRDVSGTVSPMQGVPALVVVYPKSGMIAGYSANVGKDASGKSNFYSQVP